MLFNGINVLQNIMIDFLIKKSHITLRFVLLREIIK